MTVTVFSKPDCMPCKMTKNELEKLGITFATVDVTQDQEGFERVVSLGYRQMPVVVAGDKHWSGFQPAMISSLNELLHA